MESRKEFKIISLNTSQKTGTRKKSVPEVIFVEKSGIQGDAHAGKIENRQVSLLSQDEVDASLASSRAKEKGFSLSPGDFGENVTTRGVTLETLPLGTKIYIGDNIELEVSKIGKECHTGCEISKIVGQCIMPKKGIFARVLKGGKATSEDRCYYAL